MVWSGSTVTVMLQSVVHVGSIATVNSVDSPAPSAGTAVRTVVEPTISAAEAGAAAVPAFSTVKVRHDRAPPGQPLRLSASAPINGFKSICLGFSIAKPSKHNGRI